MGQISAEISSNPGSLLSGNQQRSAWEAYNKRPRFCLKMRSDYEQLDRYLSCRRLTSPDTRRKSVVT